MRRRHNPKRRRARDKSKSIRPPDAKQRAQLRMPERATRASIQSGASAYSHSTNVVTGRARQGEAQTPGEGAEVTRRRTHGNQQRKGNERRERKPSTSMYEEICHLAILTVQSRLQKEAVCTTNTTHYRYHRRRRQNLVARCCFDVFGISISFSFWNYGNLGC